MNRIVGCLIIGLCMLAAPVLLAQTSQSQEPVPFCTAVYQRFLADRKGNDLPKYRATLGSANEYLERCSTEEGQEKIREFVSAQVPKLKETIRVAELVERFNKAAYAGNIDEAYSSGRDLIPAKPGASLDIMITMASMGFENATSKTPSEKYDTETVKYAKLVLEKLNAGEKSDRYGLFRYQYLTPECKDGGANTAGWMNYAIAMTSVRQKDVDAAIPYLYKASQTGCETKGFSDTYKLIGKWYLDAGTKLDARLSEMLKASENKETEETRSLEALVNGYLERSMDAYYRAYKLAKADEVYKKLQDIYDARFAGKKDGMDQYLANLGTASFPDPRSEVKPVIEPEPSPPATPAPAPVKKPSRSADRRV